MHTASKHNIKLDQRAIERLNQALLSIKAWAGDNLLEISLFGSYALGEQHKFSSIDLLIIICESEERFIRRKASVERFLNESDALPLIDPLIYTEDEIMDLINKKESFIDSVLKEAVVVWNGFNEIDLNDITNGKIVPSRYLPARPGLEEI
jgi:predicted nucleotidyltransferase